MIIAVAVLTALLAVLFGVKVAARNKSTGPGQTVSRQGLHCLTCGKSLKQDQLLGPASSPRCPHCGGTVKLEE